jgi:ADP-ribose 1''-phosphate phosphatase
MIHYIEDSLFNAPSDMLLCHAVNCQGVWGSGIAKEFKLKFEPEFKLYNRFCQDINYPVEYKVDLLGTALILNRVGCLFTSFDFGNKVDIPDLIILHTEQAIMDLLAKTTMKIAMPKINSGLFKVPWEKTEAALNQFDRDFYVFTGVKNG